MPGQPPPQTLRFSLRRGKRETRVTGDELQGTMGRVQTSRPLSPSRLPLSTHFHRERDVWVRGSCTKEWNRTYLICDAPLSRSARRSFAPLLACVASVSVLFRSKERPRNEILGFGRARNETRTPPRLLAPFIARSLLRNSTEMLATQATPYSNRAQITYTSVCVNGSSCECWRKSYQGSQV